MQIKYILENFCNYYNSNRQVGHSFIAINGIKSKNNSMFVVAFNQDKENFEIDKSRCVSVGEFPIAMFGRISPIAFDNHALYAIFQESLDTIKMLEKENMKLQNKLDTIKEVIK